MDAILNQLIDRDSLALANEARSHFDAWRSGSVYIPKPALRAMGRRYLFLRDKEPLTVAELYEFGRLFAFFSLVYPDGDIPSPTAIAVDFCNLLLDNSSIFAHKVSGGVAVSRSNF